jgi:tRNA-splicing ligase RtcB
VWVVIHSGSRGVGHGLATHYVKAAHPEGKCKDGHHGFSVESQEGKDYIQDLNWCLDYALANRKEMMSRTVRAITEAINISGYELDFSELINRNHNHAVEKDGLWIHRKGATHAEEGMMGVIPGNMRDGSFIVRGKGNPDSLFSSSHGAGRVMGRKQAKKELDIDQFKDDLKGVTALVDDTTLDESPLAYKNIYEVMKLQKDLVDIVAHVKPLINIKG